MDETEIDSEEMLRKVQEYYKSPRRAVRIANPHEKDDKIPEIYLGYNVADFVHESVKEKLSEVVKQEESRDKEGFYYISQLDPIYLEETRERRQLANLLIQKRKLARMHSHLKQGRSNNNPILSKVLKAQKSSQKQRYFNNKKQEENLNKVLENHPNSELTVKNLNESQSKDLKLSVTSQRAIVKARKSKEKSNVFAQESNNRNYNKTPKHLYVGKVNVKGKRDH
ncbi:MAG: Nucleolar GTP-binding protein 1, partial [Paramarteilia canceri]